LRFYKFLKIKKKDKHWKTVKEFDLDKPVLLKVLVVSAKWLNPHYKVKSFPLPIKETTKYQRTMKYLGQI